MIEIVTDWLLWIVVAAILAQWVVATAFFWSILPPYLLILAALLIVLLGSQLLEKLMPVDSHWSVYVFRAIQTAIGVLLVVVRLS